MNADQLIEQLNWRYAVKKFDAHKKIDENSKATLQEALRLSPSSFGLQPWKFLWIQNADTLAKLTPVCWNQAQPESCSHMIVMCRKLRFGEAEIDAHMKNLHEIRNTSDEELAGYKKMILGFLGQMNPEQMNTWMDKQIYLALGNLLTTCAVLGIDACPMEGFVPEKVSEVLKLEKKGLYPTVLCPIGYRASDDNFAKLPKVRFAANDVNVEI